MSSNYQYVIDLVRREVPEGSPFQTMVWPFYYWSAVVPEKITEETPNIFEQLYMSIKMVSKEIDPKDIFQQLRIEPELYKSIEKSCKEDGFEIESQKNKNENLTSIKIFKDAVVGKLVPELTIKEIPREYKLDNVEYKPEYNVSTKTKPNVYEIERMLRNFKINKRRFNEEILLDIIDSSTAKEDSWDDDEGDWNLEPTESDDKNVVTMDEIDGKIARMVQIDDIYPELVWVRTKIYIDPINSDIIRMLSPFRNVPNFFFDNILSLATRDENFRDILELCKITMLENAKDSIAFNNEYSIPILNNHPVLSNYEDYADIKYRIQEVYKAKKSIEEDKSSAYDNFFNRCGKLLEALFQHVINNLTKDERAKIKKFIHASDFSFQLSNLLESLNQVDYSMVIRYSVNHVYACLDKKTITPKSGIIVLAFYVSKINHDKEELFKNNTTIVSDVYDIYCMRNKYNHNTNVDIDDDTDPYAILETSYDKLMNIVDSITDNFFKVEK